jgi:glycosyltransferase involved in cell wall biosynthesis
MKILHVVQLLHAKGGIEQLVLSMLRKTADNAFVFVLQGSEAYAINTMPALSDYKKNIYFANLELNGKIKTIRYLRKLCKQLAITAIHTHYTGPLLYAYFATLGLKPIIHIHTEHDTWHLTFWHENIIEKTLIAINKKLQLVAVSKQIQEGLEKYFTHKKSILIHNGIDTTVFKPGKKNSARTHFNLPLSEIIIGSAGSLLPIKGHRYLIEAMMELPNQFHLAIAGGGPLLQELTQLIGQLQLEHRVHLLGSVENMGLFYQGCDLFCHPSINEGLPLVLLEAQANNLVTVCSRVGGCSEAIDPDSGVLIEPKNPQAIAKACLLVHEKKGTPREFIKNNFSLENMMEQYNTLYRGIRNVNSD